MNAESRQARAALVVAPAADSSRWRPSANRRALALRARLYGAIRDWFERAGVMEVETPTLSAFANTDPAIESLALGSPSRYLRTSPEFALKRLLAAGSGPVYELGRVYRADEQGRLHNPEFTMLEWYRPDYSLDRLIDDTVALVQLAFDVADGAGAELHRVEADYLQLINSSARLNVLDAPLDRLRARVRELFGAEGSLSRTECADLLFARCSTDWPANRLTVVRGFPEGQAALARLDPERPDQALRFELFAGPLELANGYDELVDAETLARRLSEENQRRKNCGQRPMPVDANLLAAQAHGLPACCGVSVGVDRLLMCIGGYERIDEVLAFSWSHA